MPGWRDKNKNLLFITVSNNSSKIPVLLVTKFYYHFLNGLLGNTKFHQGKYRWPCKLNHWDNFPTPFFIFCLKLKNLLCNFIAQNWYISSSRKSGKLERGKSQGILHLSYNPMSWSQRYDVEPIQLHSWMENSHQGNKSCSLFTHVNVQSKPTLLFRNTTKHLCKLLFLKFAVKT